jgi:Activator of Hsp90 ATPase homolog 1-like protein
MIEPLRLSFEVACDRHHAFTIWTERASVWWPAEHTVSRERGVEIVFEGRIGGRIFERTHAGREYEWGRVTAWDPPRRIAYLWHIATERTNATDVEIRFVALGAETTRVEVVHSGWDRLGQEQGEDWRNINRNGWDGVVPDYKSACATVA